MRASKRSPLARAARFSGFNPLQSPTLSKVVQRLGPTPMQVAQARLLKRSLNTLLIRGTSSVAHLRENLAVAEMNLPADVMATLDSVQSR
jgi:pyridoxine 4-dehydrogenase